MNEALGGGNDNKFSIRFEKIETVKVKQSVTRCKITIKYN